jgi:hypothetical protein
MLNENRHYTELKKMTDAALLRLFRDDWNNLTAEGKLALQAEIRERNISLQDDSTLQEVSQKKITHELLFLENAIRTKIPYTEITDYLKSNGLSYNELKNESAQLKDKLEEKNKQITPARLTGVTFLVIGLAIRMLPYRHDANPLFNVISYSLMLFGALRFIHGWIGKKQNEQMLDDLSKWEQSLDQKPVEYWTTTSSYLLPPEETSSTPLSVKDE